MKEAHSSTTNVPPAHSQAAPDPHRRLGLNRQMLLSTPPPPPAGVPRTGAMERAELAAQETFPAHQVRVSVSVGLKGSGSELRRFTSTPRYFATPPEAPISGRMPCLSGAPTKSRPIVRKTGGVLSLLRFALAALFLRHSVKERLDRVPGAFPESLTLVNRQVCAVRDNSFQDCPLLDGNSR